MINRVRLTAWIGGAFLLFVPAGFVSADPPATQPTTQPTIRELQQARLKAASSALDALRRPPGPNVP